MAGFWRLAWKEYRAIRLFWLMLAGLSVLLQWMTVALWPSEPSVVTLVYNYALGVPVLFAVACAATTFAVEREEGTSEFLRAAPISAWQVLASKLAIAAIGTAAMMIVLLPLARQFAQRPVPIDEIWNGILGLWLVSAFEAIAWGTLFSLIGTRPLVAVVLTLVAVSTCDHVLARLNKGPTPEVFEWLAYLRAPRGAVESHWSFSARTFTWGFAGWMEALLVGQSGSPRSQSGSPVRKTRPRNCEQKALPYSNRFSPSAIAARCSGTCSGSSGGNRGR